MFFLKDNTRLHDVIKRLLSNFKKIFQNPKTHDFGSFEKDADYFVNFQKSGQFATLTTTERIKIGEIIILNYDNKAIEYCVEAVDRYWNSNSIRTVWLKKANPYLEKVAKQFGTISSESQRNLVYSYQIERRE